MSDNIVTESIYSEISPPSRPNRSSRLVRKDAIKMRDGRKPPLPPVFELPYSTTNKKVPKSVRSRVKDETSISDDLDSDTRSVLYNTVKGKHHHRLAHPTKVSSSNINKVPKRYDTKPKLISSSTSRLSQASDSGILQNFASSDEDDNTVIRLNKHELLDLPKRLHMLIDMYQRKLNDHEQIITKSEAELIELRDDQRNMAIENDTLKHMIEELRSGFPADIEEWKLLKQQAELVLEENDNLQSQAHLLQTKLRESHLTHKKQITELMHKLEISHDQRSIDQAELKQLRDRFDKLREEYNLLVLKSRDSMPKDEHSQSIRDSKRLLDALKDRYEVDVDKANELIKRLQNEKAILSTKLESVTSDNEQLTIENGVLIQSHKKDLNNIRHLRKSLSKINGERTSLKFKVKGFQYQAFTTCEDVGNLFLQIERAAAHESKIRHLLASKVTLLDELQRQALRTKEMNERQLQRCLDETKRKLKKLKEKTDEN